MGFGIEKNGLGSVLDNGLWNRKNGLGLVLDDGPGNRIYIHDNAAVRISPSVQKNKTRCLFETLTKIVDTGLRQGCFSHTLSNTYRPCTGQNVGKLGL